MDGYRGAAARIFDPHGARGPMIPRSPMWNLLAVPNALGAAAARHVNASGRAAVALAEVLSRTAAGAAYAPPGGRRLVARTTVMQVYFTGVQSVPVAGFFALLVGLGFGHLVERSGFFLLVPIGQDVIVEQLGVFVAALAVVARSAPAVAVELANMKVAGELKMLEGFGVDPFRHCLLYTSDAADE